MSSWEYSWSGYKPDREGLREALCTLGNGYFATRGAGCETRADGVHYPGTYLAGGYNRAATEIAGRLIENEDLVNLPNWLPLTFSLDARGPWFDLDSREVLEYEQKLDLKAGLLVRQARLRDSEGRITSVTERRLVSMADIHTAALELSIVPEDWSGAMTIKTAIDGTVLNRGVARYRRLEGQHLEPRGRRIFDEDCMFLKMETNHSALQVTVATRTRVFLGGRATKPERLDTEQPCAVCQEFTVQAEEGVEVRLEKVAALFTSRDHAIVESGLEARRVVAEALDFQELAERQAVAWKHLWSRFDVNVGLCDSAEGEHVLRVLRLHLFHLLQTSSAATMDLDVGVPARGWHGEAYRGHIFWDELFIFPILNLRLPEITRSLLMYRYRRLGEARRAARAAGCRGAMFPWQSGSNGREESQRLHLNPRSGNWLPDNTWLQWHVNSAIAYNVWQYYQVTRDIEFLAFYGAEMFLEIARFWASTATLDENGDRYQILGVMGPDEYHDAYPDAEEPGLDNNAYTNVMAAWVLSKALDILRILPPDRSDELLEILRIEEDELELWDAISRKLKVPFHDDGIISQFDGYERLREFDWEGYERKYGDIQRLDRILEAEGDTVNRYQASKQADVLMLFYLFSADEIRSLFERLGYSLPPEGIPKNVDYYLKRTSHGSTLSRVVHSWVMSRSNRAGSWRLFRQALDSDVGDIQGGTTSEGIHLGAMAGVVDLVQRCYTGLEVTGEALSFNPRLPEECTDLRLSLRYRGHTLLLHINRKRLEVQNISLHEGAVQIVVPGATYSLPPGEILRHPLSPEQTAAPEPEVPTGVG